jgi:hypothetical protein
MSAHSTASGQYQTLVAVEYVDKGDDSVCLLPYTYVTDSPHTHEEAAQEACRYAAQMFDAIGEGTRVIGAQITSRVEVAQ